MEGPRPIFGTPKPRLTGSEAKFGGSGANIGGSGDKIRGTGAKIVDSGVIVWGPEARIGAIEPNLWFLGSDWGCSGQL